MDNLEFKELKTHDFYKCLDCQASAIDYANFDNKCFECGSANIQKCNETEKETILQEIYENEVG